MHFLIHGDYHIESRQFLFNLVSEAKSKNKEIIRINGEKTDLNEIIQATTSNSLFGNEKLVVLENLFSRRKSSQQKEILDFFKKYDSPTELIFWEKKKVGKVAQRSLPKNTQTKEFKTPALIFKLVEYLTPKTKKQAIEMFEKLNITEAVEFIFAMIARQIRILILIKNSEKVPGAPWMIGKWKKQAREFEEDKLLSLYQKLFKIDEEIKTGKTIMPLAWHLEVWLAEI